MKKVLSVLLSLCLLLAFSPLQAYAAMNAEQLFKYSEFNASEGFKNGITVLENGDIYVITSGNAIKGFYPDGTSNGFSAALPTAYSGNLCSFKDEILFAHATNSSSIFVFEPLKSTSYKELYCGSNCHFLTTDSNGYLYSLQGRTNDAGKKVAIINKVKISTLKTLSNGSYISWEKSYIPNYQPPNDDGNAYPKALAVDAAGNAYIVDKGSSSGSDASVNGIYKYNLKTGKVTTMKFVNAGGATVGMVWLYAVNVDAFGNVAVLSRNSNMIALFRPGSVTADNLIGTKGWVEDLASDTNGDLYFVSNGNANTGSSVFKCALNNVKASGISIDKASLSLKVGKTGTLKGTVAPSDATNKEVLYFSSNTAVATVSETGNVKAVGAGTAVITAKSAEGAYTKTCKVTVTKNANTLTVKAKKPTIKYSKLKKKNQTIARKNAISVSKAKGTVTYKKASGNKKITVSKVGKFTVKKGLKKGTYKVKVKVTAAGSNAYKAATKTVTVTIIVK